LQTTISLRTQKRAFHSVFSLNYPKRVVNPTLLLPALSKKVVTLFWTGFYRVVSDELRLGPFQGSVACSRIGYGRGVCGTAWQRQSTIVVPDVEQFPGHIACSSLSRSEIVVPVKKADGTVTAVLDIDSTALGTFDETDRLWMERICALMPAE
jgi:GAF domain-containing protein